jgi:hypothetical protein
MKPVLVVNAENGWDNVSYVLDSEAMTPEQWDQLEEVCEKHDYILIDWKSFSNVESFLQDHE